MLSHNSKSPNLQMLGEAVRVLKNVESRAGTFDLQYWDTCALGHFTGDKVFKRAGLRWCNERGMPVFGNVHAGFRSPLRLFSITKTTCLWLFSASSYDVKDHHNPKVVIARIETLIREFGPAMPKLETEVSEAIAAAAAARRTKNAHRAVDVLVAAVGAFIMYVAVGGLTS
jgi:hypothetical protein